MPRVWTRNFPAGSHTPVPYHKTIGFVFLIGFDACCWCWRDANYKVSFWKPAVKRTWLALVLLPVLSAQGEACSTLCRRACFNCLCAWVLIEAVFCDRGIWNDSFFGFLFIQLNLVGAVDQTNMRNYCKHLVCVCVCVCIEHTTLGCLRFLWQAWFTPHCPLIHLGLYRRINTSL